MLHFTLVGLLFSQNCGKTDSSWKQLLRPESTIIGRETAVYGSLPVKHWKYWPLQPAQLSGFWQCTNSSHFFSFTNHPILLADKSIRYCFSWKYQCLATHNVKKFVGPNKFSDFVAWGRCNGGTAWADFMFRGDGTDSLAMHCSHPTELKDKATAPKCPYVSCCPFLWPGLHSTIHRAALPAVSQDRD